MNQLIIYFISALGLGVGITAALFTFRHTNPPKGSASDEKRQDALERLKIWTDFWKYFLVSFALVLITSVLGNTLKEREQEIQQSKQVAELALETAKESSTNLIAENTNLGSFLDRALSEDWRKQYAFASYFSHLTRDPEARKRWEDYAKFIVDTKTQTPIIEDKVQTAIAAIANLRKNAPDSSELRTKEEDLLKLRTQLDLNQAVLQPEGSTSRYRAPKHNVSNLGAPPDSFLDELVAWGKTAPEDIFSSDDSLDPEGIYAGIDKQLGPWKSHLQRRAAMLEVMRVLAGFESGWNWSEGRDLTNSSVGGPATEEAGAWQVTASSMSFSPDLKDFVMTKLGTLDPVAFQRAIKADHQFAMEYVARLLKHTTRHHGPLIRHVADAWLRRDSVEEFKSLIEADPSQAPAVAP